MTAGRPPNREMQPGIYSCSLHPSDEELKDTRRDRVKKGVLVNTPTFTWAYTRMLKERGKREIRITRLTSVVSSNEMGGFLSK